MPEDARKVRKIVTEVAAVGLRDEHYATIDLRLEGGEILSLDLTTKPLAPVIMALFSAASALQERRYAATRTREVLALPVSDAAATAVAVGGERHVVVSIKLGEEAVFRFSLPPCAAARLSETLSLAVGKGLN